MNEKEKCDECKFFNGHKLCLGECRKHAPAYGKNVHGDNHVWPEVYHDEWCGDFKLKGVPA